MLRSFTFSTLFMVVFIAFAGCTISIIQTDTHGLADDVVDSEPKTDAKVDANLEIPVKAV